MVVEDSPAGIAAARAAGMLVIGLTTTHRQAEVDGADVVVPDLASVSFGVTEIGIQVA